MAGRRSLRTIGDPVVAAAPAGVRIRTRIPASAAEAAGLAVIGDLLGSVYRCEMVERIGLGWLDRASQAAWRAERKRAVTAVSSSRWAGAITRAVEDQYQLGMRGLATEVRDRRAAVEVLEQRCALRAGELAPVQDDDSGDPSRRPHRGYRSAAERFNKTRRLAVLQNQLAAAEDALANGRKLVLQRRQAACLVRRAAIAATAAPRWIPLSSSSTGASSPARSAGGSSSTRHAAWRCCKTSLRSHGGCLGQRSPVDRGGRQTAVARNRNHLDAAEMTEQRWRERWDAARMFLTADGEWAGEGRW